MVDELAYTAAAPIAGVRSRFVAGVNGLTLHVLEAGEPGRPCLLLLHGFPELAYSWRKVMPALAAAGFHVLAPDQRGYGRTTGWDGRYEGDVGSFRLLNLVRDASGLLHALGIPRVTAVIGHDFGSPVAAWCALVRPDVFRSVVLMSAPFAGPPSLDAGTAVLDIHQELAKLVPPRKHYQWYYSTPGAEADMMKCPEGLHSFLRAYYHHKSADWPANRPYPLTAWTAGELEKLPTYYIMELDKGMAATVAPAMPSEAEITACAWLSEAEFAVYSSEFGRTGLQGGLNWYRCGTDERYRPELEIFAGRTIDVPSMFIAGKSDWGTYQRPGAFEAMQRTACTDLRGCHLVEGAGHWVQQEQPAAVTRLLVEFLAGLPDGQ